MIRTILPNRRPSITVDANWQGMPLTVTVGFDLDGVVREVFADAPGSVGVVVSDASTVISIALQHDIPAPELAKSLGRAPDFTGGKMIDAPASPIGVIINCIIEAST